LQRGGMQEWCSVHFEECGLRTVAGAEVTSVPSIKFNLEKYICRNLVPTSSSSLVSLVTYVRALVDEESVFRLPGRQALRIDFCGHCVNGFFRADRTFTQGITPSKSYLDLHLPITLAEYALSSLIVTKNSFKYFLSPSISFGSKNLSNAPITAIMDCSRFI
jgi:hypothetical protein